VRGGGITWLVVGCVRQWSDFDTHVERCWVWKLGVLRSETWLWRPCAKIRIIIPVAHWQVRGRMGEADWTRIYRVAGAPEIRGDFLGYWASGRLFVTRRAIIVPELEATPIDIRRRWKHGCQGSRILWEVFLTASTLNKIPIAGERMTWRKLLVKGAPGTTIRTQDSPWFVG
jgi:hypothetical protein